MTSPDFQTPAGTLSPAAMNWLQGMLAKPIGKEGKQILQALASIGDSMLSRFFKGYTDIADVFSHAFDELGAELGGIPGMSGVQAWVDDIESLLTNALDLIDNVFTGVTDIVDGLAFAVTGRGVEGNIAEGMHMVVQGLTVFLELVNAAMDMLKELIDGVLGVAGGTMHQLVQVLSWVIGVANQFLLFFNGIYDVFGDLLDFAPGGDRPLAALLAGLPKLLSVFSPIDAGKLFGELPDVIVDSLRGLIGAVLGSDGLILPWLLPKLSIGQLTGGPVDLAADGGFVGLPSGGAGSSGWWRDPAAGRTKAGCAAVTGDGTAQELITAPFAVEAGRKVQPSIWVDDDGATGSASPVVFALTTFAAGEEVGRIQVASTALGWSGWKNLAAEVTIPVGVDQVAPTLLVTAGLTGGVVRWDDLEVFAPGLIEQSWVQNLQGDLAAIVGWVDTLVNAGLGALGIPALGSLFDRIMDFADGLDDWRSGTNGTAADLESLLGGLLTDPTSVIGPIPQTLVTGLGAALGNLLPKADWTGFLTQFTAAGMSGTAPSLGVPLLDDAITAFLGVRSSASAAAVAASSNTAAIAELRSLVGQQATPAYVGNEMDMASFPRSMLFLPEHAHVATPITAPTGGPGFLPTFTPSGAQICFVPIWADRRGNLSRLRFIGGGNGWFNTGLASIFYGLYSFSRAGMSGTLTKLWDSGNVQAMTDTGAVQEFSIDMGLAGALTVPGNLLFVAFVQNRNAYGSGRPVTAIPQGGIARPSDVLLKGSMFTTSGTTLPSTVGLSNLTANTSWLPWMAVSVTPEETS